MSDKTNKIEPSKPFCLELEAARIEIFTAISQAAKTHNIPFFLLEGIISDALTQVREGKRGEVESAQKQYADELGKYTKEQSESETK